MSKKTYLERFGYLFILAVLTFVIPLLQWSANKLIEPSRYGALLGDALIIIVLSYWCVREKLFSYFPSSNFWKAVLYLLGVSSLVLLILNVRNRPVSEITGQARLPFEVVDVIVLGPIAEELVFRGAMWSIFKQLFKGDNENKLALVGTSVLFGIEHLGYWAQSSWPLPLYAYIHSLSMVLVGLLFGIFRMKTRSLTMPIAIHILANSIVLLFQ